MPADPGKSPGPPAGAGLPGWPLLAALAAWNAAALGWFLHGFWMPPSVLKAAASQYLVEPAFSASGLWANWRLFGEAAIAAAGLTAVAARAGGRIRRLFGLAPDPPRTIAFGFGALGTAILGLGLVGLIQRPPAAVSLAVLACLALDIVRKRRAVAAAVAECRPGFPPLSPLCRAGLAAAIAVALVGVLNVEMSWDALTYHLRLPSFYAYRHKVYDVWHHYCSTFPSLIEMIYLLCQLVSGDLAARMLNAGFGLGLAASLPRLARAAWGPGGGRAAAGSGFALLAGSPLFLLLLGRAYIDLGFAWFIVLGLSDLMAWRRAGGAGLRFALSSGLLAGCGLSSKYVGALALPAYLAAALAPPSRRPAAAVARAAAGWAIAAALPLLPWLLRNWLFRANPVSPLLGGVFGTHEVIPGDVTPLFSLHDPLRTLAATIPARIEALLLNHGRIDGPVAAAVAGLLPLLALRGAPPAVRPLAAFVLAYLAGWLLLSPDVRFFLPALPVFGLVAGEAAGRIAAGLARLPRLAARALLETQLLAGALYGTAVLWVFFDPLGMALGLASAESRLELGLPPAPYTYYMKTWVNEHVPPDGRIWFLSHPFTYYVDRECIADFHFGASQFTRLAREAPTTPAMAKRFRELGVEWLLGTGSNATQYSAIPGYFDVPAGAPAAFKRLLQTRATAVWQTEHFTLYRLGRPHPARPLPDLPIFAALAWQVADRELSEGRAREALEAFQAPPPLLADVGSTFVRQGDAWMTVENPAQAVGAFRRALELGADQPRVRTGLAQALLRLGRPAEALPHAEAGWRESPLSPYAAAGLALTYARLGRGEEARRLIREAVRLKPRDADYAALAKTLGAD